MKAEVSRCVGKWAVGLQGGSEEAPFAASQLEASPSRCQECSIFIFNQFCLSFGVRGGLLPPRAVPQLCAPCVGLGAACHPPARLLFFHARP